MTSKERQEVYDAVLNNRGVFTPCPDCGGIGTQVYPTTATWRKGGVAGMAFTVGVCDTCWGSGDKDRHWPSHREFYEMKERLRRLEDE